MEQYSLFQPQNILSVSQLTGYLRQLIEDDDLMQDLWVEGEISNFSRPSSGHLYFTLKDSQSAIRCVMWRNSAARLTFEPREGLAVEAHGGMGVYETSGQVQLYVDTIRPAGEGLLFQEFLRLKAKLEAEGLFDPSTKQPIPTLPKVIAPSLHQRALPCRTCSTPCGAGFRSLKWSSHRVDARVAARVRSWRPGA